MRRLFLTLVAATAVHASHSAEPITASLSVKPVLCIVDERTPTCSPNFQITWRAARLGDYCILRENDEEPLRCWSDSRSGGAIYDRELPVQAETRSILSALVPAVPSMIES